jgi:hypothetical protein
MSGPKVGRGETKITSALRKAIFETITGWWLTYPSEKYIKMME